MVACPSKALVDFDECRQETLSDGSRYLFVQGYVHDRDRGAKQWRSTLLTPAGVLIDASEYNAPEEKGAAVTRADPPLTPARMKSLVTADEWDPIAAAYQAEAGAPPEEGPVVRAGRRGEDRRRADGPAAQRTGGHGPGRRAGLRLRRGRRRQGASFVQINVQPGMSDLAGDFAGGRRCPTGRCCARPRTAIPTRRAARARSAGRSTPCVRTDSGW
ncbi:hypothetical protein ACFQ60_27370 [Streptomyces zhihengii]